MSHTTVNAALRGTKMPSWPVLAKLVNQLEGDEEHFRHLWVATRESDNLADSAFDAPGDADVMRRTDVSVFASYARMDDESSYGRISKFIEDLGRTYSSITGLDVGVFKDTKSIAPGEDWKDRIRLGLASSSIFLAFISPSYLRSPNCRAELTEFLAFLTAKSTQMLVIPLLFFPASRIKKMFGDDSLWQQLSNLNYLDISDLRHEETGSSPWLRKVEDIAERIEEVLSAADVEDSSARTGSGSGSGSAPAARLAGGAVAPLARPSLEYMTEIEQATPQTVEDLQRVLTLMEQLGAEVTAFGPQANRAKTFSQKLNLTKRLAKRIDPIASDLESTAFKVRDAIAGWDVAVRAITGQMIEDPKMASSPDGESFIRAIEEFSGAAEIAGQLGEFYAVIGGGKGLSKDLDRPLGKIQDAVLHLAEMVAMVNGWRDELEVLSSYGSDS
ncbi:toll/interleukin-1 receptor domain-containing protein [Dactylosporangium sp. CS-047395]|uniref:toll/interleukin-1 receptor domain-containing protein n=1 Tax=Dactylosporangium sp. CS-047395 TaxID=3239936 RepID=UPI003D940AF1